MQSLEGREYSLMISFFDAGAVIANEEQPGGAVPVRGDVDYRLGGLTVFRCIVEQMAKNPDQLFEVASYHGKRVMGDARRAPG